MRKYLLAILLSLSLFGCAGGFGDLKVSKPDAQLTTPAQKAEAGINQGYATHAAITATLLQNYKDGVITKAQKDSYAKRTKEGLGYIDQADTLVGSGDLASAQAQIILAQTIFAAIQQELVKYATKKGN